MNLRNSWHIHKKSYPILVVRVHNAIIEGLTSYRFNGQLTKFSFSKHTTFLLHQTPPPCLHIKSTWVENEKIFTIFCSFKPIPCLPIQITTKLLGNRELKRYLSFELVDMELWTFSSFWHFHEPKINWKMRPLVFDRYLLHLPLK